MKAPVSSRKALACDRVLLLNRMCAQAYRVSSFLVIFYTSFVRFFFSSCQGAAAGGRFVSFLLVVPLSRPVLHCSFLVLEPRCFTNLLLKAENRSLFLFRCFRGSALSLS